jgi:hypothetical protein
MSDLLPTYRITSQPRALHYSFEKAGLVLHDQPIPWNAEAVLVEANLHLPHVSLRQSADFTLLVPGREPVCADSVRKQEGSDADRHSVSFRLLPPEQTQTIMLQWRGRELGQLELPLLRREQFLDGLRLHLPTLYVQLGGESVACKTFVSSQCKGLLASALLSSPTSLAPLADFSMAVEFKSEREPHQRVAVRLNSSQLASRQALFTVTPLKHPRKLGTWSASWLLGERELAREEARGISLRQFQKSLRVMGTRYVLQGSSGAVTLARTLPPPERRERVGPCFLVCSREAGMAGLCSLRVAAVVPGAVTPPGLWEQDVLITDGPALLAPGTLEGAELAQVQAFDLTLQGRSLSVLALTPAPSATFTSEGGFHAPSEFAWTSAADDELDQRLSRLLEERFRST